MKSFFKVILVFIISYFSIVFIAKVRVINKQDQFQETIKRLDKENNLRNENGEFTEEYHKAYEKASGNTALNLAPITAILYSLFITLIFYFVLFRKEQNKELVR